MTKGIAMSLKLIADDFHSSCNTLQRNDHLPWLSWPEISALLVNSLQQIDA